MSARSFHSGLPSRLAQQVPDRVDDRRGREVDDALLGADPAQLAVADQTHTRSRRSRRRSSSSVRPTTSGREDCDRRDAQLVAAARREREAVALGPPGRRSAGRRTRPSSRATGSSRPTRRASRTWGSGRRSADDSVMVMGTSTDSSDCAGRAGCPRRRPRAPADVAGYLKSAALSLVTISVPVSTFGSTVSPLAAL